MTVMPAATLPATAPGALVCPRPGNPERACWLRAWDRARAEQLIPYRATPLTWSVKTYTVTVTGPGWSDLTCDCSAGSHGLVCKHAAVVAKAIACRVSPIRGSAKGEGYETTHEPDFRYQIDPADAPDPCHARQVKLGRAAHGLANAHRSPFAFNDGSPEEPAATWLPSGANDGFTRLVIRNDPLAGLWN